MVEAVLFSACDEWSDKSKIESLCKDIQDREILDMSMKLVGDKEFIMASFVKDLNPGRHRLIWITSKVALVVEEDPVLTAICDQITPATPTVSPASSDTPPPEFSLDSQIDFKIDLAD